LVVHNKLILKQLDDSISDRK